MPDAKFDDFGNFTAERSGDDIGFVDYRNDDGDLFYKDVLRKHTKLELLTGEQLSATYPTWFLCDQDGTISDVGTNLTRMVPSGGRKLVGTDMSTENVKVGMVWNPDIQTVEEAPPKVEIDSEVSNSNSPVQTDTNASGDVSTPTIPQVSAALKTAKLSDKQISDLMKIASDIQI